ncbi:hypothetical protein [Clostridium sp. BJN0001]|uniref:hypothetical protein n=1 Tax=Clostridium sp. BJN0001 TaxID=2930219 RepID=UPI001FD62556|nr:hypothetical protein [Clostridium sp. BJN0001]
MNTLTTYVNNTFSGVPQTEEIKQLKSEILNRMESDYKKLQSEGKSDEEIVGIIISEFSNISDLINEKLKAHNSNEFHQIESKNKKLVKSLMKVYWLITVAVYFFISFVFNIWEFSWIIFIIAPALKEFYKNYYDL